MVRFSLKAVAIGILIDVVGTTLLTMLVVLYIIMAVQRSPPIVLVRDQIDALGLLVLGISLGMNLFGGFVAGQVARREFARHGAAVGVFNMVYLTAAELLGWNQGSPPWLLLGMGLGVVPAAALGGYLAGLRTSPQKPWNRSQAGGVLGFMRKFSVLTAVLAVGLATSACDIKTSANGEFSFDIAGGKATETWSRSYKVAENGRFELINVNGRITAEKTDGTELVVEGRKTAKARSDEAARELLGKLEIREEVGTSTVRVESRPPRSSGGFNGHEIEWTIKVPTGVVLDLRTVNGGVRLRNLANEIHAKTTNGGVEGEGIIPSLIEASAVNGGIEFTLGAPLDSSDSIEFETVNGGVTLELPTESKATIAARCVNGGVHVENLDIAREETANARNEFEKRRRLNGTMNGGGAKVNMSTTNGGVHLTGIGLKKTT